MESSSFDRLTRLIGSSTGRRTALAASAATGLAALTAGTADAQSPQDRIKNRLPKGPRGKRGKRGKNGKPGRPGAPLAAGIKVVTQPCDPGVLTEGQSHFCTASCGSGFVATGGGYDIGDFTENLAVVRVSEPDLDPNNIPQGWSVRIVSILDFNLDYTVYAVCVPS